MKPSPILALAAKAAELKASGKDVVSLTIGEPDWSTYENIKEAGIKAIRDGKTTYAPANGILELRKVIAAQVTGDFGLTYEAADVTVSAGAKMILFAALQCLCDPGDEVILPAPFWASYSTMVELAEAVPHITICPSETNFKLTPELLRRSINSRTKALLLNSPSNPTGQIYSKEELLALAVVLREHPRVIVISDDIYNRLCLDGQKVAAHILQVAPDLRERVVIVNGASKSYSMTGWRLGWALGPRSLIGAMTAYQSQVVSCASMISQVAAIEAVTNSDKHVSQTIALLQKRAAHLVPALSKIPGLKVFQPQGAFYIWLDVSAHLGRSCHGKKLTSSADLAAALLEYQLVAVVPGSDFGVEGAFRLSFAIDDRTAQIATERMHEFFASTLV
jgi:aspartate aminotransferase